MSKTRSYLDERRAARRWQAITGIVAAGALAAAALWVLHRTPEQPEIAAAAVSAPISALAEAPAALP